MILVDWALHAPVRNHCRQIICLAHAIYLHYVLYDHVGQNFYSSEYFEEQHNTFKFQRHVSASLMPSSVEGKSYNKAIYMQ